MVYLDNRNLVTKKSSVVTVTITKPDPRGTSVTVGSVVHSTTRSRGSQASADSDIEDAAND
jgi:hypothetical protein